MLAHLLRLCPRCTYICGTEIKKLPPLPAGLLLGLLFFYDIFWVFFTPVMVEVAKNFDAPIKLLFRRVPAIAGAPAQFSMLGLGDIVLPGLFVALILRCACGRGGLAAAVGDCRHCCLIVAPCPRIDPAAKVTCRNQQGSKVKTRLTRPISVAALLPSGTTPAATSGPATSSRPSGATPPAWPPASSS